MSAPVVYRLFAEDGTLLYIGHTDDFANRLALHLSTTMRLESRVAGWEAIHERYHHHTLEAHPTTADAKAAEIAAIRAERPLLNVHYNTGRVWVSRPAKVKTVVLDSPGHDFSSRLAFHLGRAMLDAGHSTASLAQASGVTPGRLARALLNGNPHAGDLFAVTDALGIQAFELYRRAEQVTA